jgi:uncharacterized membrane protein
MEEEGLGTFFQYSDVMLSIAQIFEIIAALTIFSGLIWSAALALRTYRRSKSGQQTYKTMRRSFGGSILLGLEILVAGDLIRTVAVDPTIESVTVLGIIRTFLSFSLEIEMNGVPPWRRALVSGATVMKKAAADVPPKAT